MSIGVTVTHSNFEKIEMDKHKHKILEIIVIDLKTMQCFPLLCSSSSFYNTFARLESWSAVPSVEQKIYKKVRNSTLRRTAIIAKREIGH